MAMSFCLSSPSATSSRSLLSFDSSSRLNRRFPCSDWRASSHSPLKLACLDKSSKYPVIRAELSTSVPDYSADVKFYKVEAIVRPWRAAHVSAGLVEMGIKGATISDVRGFGVQGGSKERHEGSEFSEDKFVSKIKMEIVVCKEQVEEVIDKIIEKARTGEIGDGKIFVIPVSDVIRVRTGERGEKAERMSGGRTDMISSIAPN
ncbi:hypothetical protein LUZ60_003454 [Juncus effusus]|nr:hypothetical protein LUZ60_003454 [Juncus effusus]